MLDKNSYSNEMLCKILDELVNRYFYDATDDGLGSLYFDEKYNMYTYLDSEAEREAMRNEFIKDMAKQFLDR